MKEKNLENFDMQFIDTLFFDNLETSCLLLVGIDKKSVLKLQELGFDYIYQFLYNFPKRYNIYKNLFFQNALDGDDIAIEALLINFSTFKSILKATFVDNNKTKFTVLWFHSSFLLNILIKNKKYLLLGRRKNNCIIQPKVRNIPAIAKEVIIVNYKKDISKISLDVLNKVAALVYETISTKNSHERIKSFFGIHLPNNENDIEQAKKFFAQEKSFYYLAQAEESRIRRTFKLTNVSELVHDFLKLQNLHLTSKQKKSFDEIVQIICQGSSFDILLHGEVASGKTFVAFASALFFIFNGYKVIFVVPTVALFHQTMQFLRTSLGSVFKVKAFVRGEKYESAHIVVATHSIIYDELPIEDVGLIIIDEEQKFGVLQREQIMSKCCLNNCLLLSATPIPRTLSLSQNNRIHSVFIEASSRHIDCKVLFLEDNHWIVDLQTRMKREKILCVVPRISEGRYSAEELFFMLSGEETYLVHGKMMISKQQQTLEEFSEKHKGILICTSVFEVGVNIANLSTVFIVNANLFGLSSLHQIRGRVGRESGKGQCFFVISNLLDQSSKDTFQLLCDIQHGYKVAELDAANRGGGDMYGTTQFGYFDETDFAVKKLVQSMNTYKRQKTIEFLSQVFSDEFKKRNN